MMVKLKIIEKWNFLNDAVKSSLVFLTVNVVHLGIGFIMSPIYTRIMSVAEYGIVSVYNSYFSVIGVVAMFCLSYGFYDNAMHSHCDARDSVAFSILILSNVITLITFILCAAIRIIFPQLINIEGNLFLMLFVTFFLQPAYSLWTSRQRYEYKYKASGIISIFLFFSSPLMAVFAILNNYFGKQSLDRLIGGYIPFYIVYIALYVYIAIKGRFKVDYSYWKEALIFNFPLIPHYMSLYILNGSDKIMIKAFCSSSDVAYYSIAVTVSTVGSILWSSINSSLVPFTYSMLDKKEYAKIEWITNPLVILNSGVTILIMLFAPELLALLAPSSYFGALPSISPLLAGSFCVSLYYLFANVIYYYNKTKYVMIGSVASAIINMALNYFFIPRHGYIAASFTTLFSYVVQAIIDYCGMRHVIKERVYNCKFIFGLSIILMLFSLLVKYLYSYLIVRICIVIMMLALLILFREKILLIFKMVKKDNFVKSL